MIKIADCMLKTTYHQSDGQTDRYIVLSLLELLYPVKAKKKIGPIIYFSPSLIEHLMDAGGSWFSICPLSLIVDWDTEIPQQ